MSDVESFVRFCESDFGAAVMNREGAYLDQHLDSDDPILDVGAGIGSTEERFPGYDIIGLDIDIELLRPPETGSVDSSSLATPEPFQ